MKISPQPRHGGRMGMPTRLGGLLLAVVALLAACAVQRTEVPVPEGVNARFTVEQGRSPAKAPPGPAIRQVTPLEVATSLRRITVRVSTWVSLVYGDPEPLFSEEQVVQFSPIIADTLRSMPEEAVLRLQCKDRFKGQSINVLIFGEGPELVYVFDALVRDEEMSRPPGDEMLDGARLEAQAGQTIASTDVQMLRHPVRVGAAARLQAQDQALARITQAREDDRITDAERSALLAVANSPDGPDTDVWDTFWERWDLLDRAHRQGLIDNAAYEQRKTELIGQLTR